MTVELENKGISTACLEVLPKEIVFSIKKKRGSMVFMCNFALDQTTRLPEQFLTDNKDQCWRCSSIPHSTTFGENKTAYQHKCLKGALKELCIKECLQTSMNWSNIVKKTEIKYLHNHVRETLYRERLLHVASRYCWWRLYKLSNHGAYLVFLEDYIEWCVNSIFNDYINTKSS